MSGRPASWPHTVSQAAQLRAGLHGDQAALAARGSGGTGQEAFGHRKKRPRRPMVGMMLHQDASTHAWLPGDGGKQDLVVTMEDATSELYSAFLVDEEGTASSLRGIREVVAKHGLFCSLSRIVAATTSRRRRQELGCRRR